MKNRIYVTGLMLCTVIANGHRCVLNPYYHPVCGNDMKTYPNKDILDCFNRQRPRHRRKYIYSVHFPVCANVSVWGRSFAFEFAFAFFSLSSIHHSLLINQSHRWFVRACVCVCFGIQNGRQNAICQPAAAASVVHCHVMHCTIIVARSLSLAYFPFLLPLRA